ncbi:MarR family winged helix-turn-helix transcriptional regulator [Burkholderia cenocepacia]|uniref:MarR family winged helix-turn-helix transcriptional regulator n=1 Tax=Burkholderia cenocepacia TaxID=95486 RepID=UPI0028561E17|nr:MarR family transcriptional regulator [Burkholderia cenocepacia]MDR5647531.1 MarR family transcriptional regulator [Burkholderia cenocepacia]
MPEITFPEAIAAGWNRERPDLAETGLSITLRLRALSMEIDHQFAKIAAQEDVQLEDMLLLFALRRRGTPYCIRPTEICAMLNITSGAATYRIDRLVKKGLCERQPDPEDGRGYLVHVTPVGMLVIDRTVEAVARASDQALRASGLSSPQLSSFLRLLSLVEHGWEVVVPPSENPLARREGPAVDYQKAQK